MTREYGDYFKDIVDSIDKIEKFTVKMSFESFAADEKTVFAVVRALEIIGEAVKSIPEFMREKYPEIPWKEMAGLRDKLIHEYFGVKLEVVWDTVKAEIPELKPKFQKILSDLENKQ